MSCRFSKPNKTRNAQHEQTPFENHENDSSQPDVGNNPSTFPSHSKHTFLVCSPSDFTPAGRPYKKWGQCQACYPFSQPYPRWRLCFHRLQFSRLWSVRHQKCCFSTVPCDNGTARKCNIRTTRLVHSSIQNQLHYVSGITAEEEG